MSMKLAAKTAALALLASVSVTAVAEAAVFNDLFVFGDSYSDTGSYVPFTNGSTAAGYLARDFGIPLTTSRNPSPGTSGVNFAETGARVDVGPTPPATQPRSLTQQVAEFQAYVTTGALTFNPASSLFLLLGGLNDHTRATQAQIAAATTAQVATLYGLGARYFEIGLLPSLVPAFADSATNINPVYRSLVPQLQAQFSGAVFGLSNWGTYYDNILRNPSQYGITNTTDPCTNFPNISVPTCATPDTYFYYVVVHPSDAAHRIVGDALYQEALALPTIPEPATLAILATGLVGLGLAGRRRKAGQRDVQPRTCLAAGQA